MSEIAQRGAEVLVGDLFFGVVMVGASAAMAITEARKEVDGHVETFRDGPDVLQKIWLDPERARGPLQTFYNVMRSHPTPGLFYSLPGLYGMHDIRMKGAPEDWKFDSLGQNGVTFTAQRLGEIPGQTIRGAAITGYERCQNQPRLYEVTRKSAEFGKLHYRALAFPQDGRLLVATEKL